MKLKALRKRLQEIQSEATSVVDAADAGGGTMTEEQREKFDALMAERKLVGDDIRRLEELEEMGASAGRKAKPAAPADPAPRTRVTDVHERVDSDPMRGFSDAADFGRAVRAAAIHGGAVDTRLIRLRSEARAEDQELIGIQGAPANFHRETGSADGYMVPPQMREEIWGLVFNGQGILDLVAPEPTESNAVQLRRDESTPWGATGIQAYWASEGSQFTPSRLKTDPSTVLLHKLYAFVLATEELLEDAPRLANRLTVGASQAIRWKAEQALIEGDGVGKPLGWLKSAALVSVAKESSQSAAGLVAKNVAKMYGRLLMSGIRDPFWLINQTVFPELATLTLGDKPIWSSPAGFKDPPGGTLFGRPVLMSEHCETLGTKGDIQLIAPNGYYAVTKTSGVKFASSIHLYFDYDMEAFRWTFRLGGQPFLSAPVSQAKGSGTLSHFVTLDTRP